MSVDARRRANVEHILRRNEIGGCGDAAVIFAQLARAKGIPVKLVDAVRKGYDGRGDFRGHVFADVFINNSRIERASEKDNSVCFVEFSAILTILPSSTSSRSA